MIGREKRKDKRDIGKVKGNENTDKDERQRRDEDGKREGEGKKKTGTEGREKVGGCAGGKGGGRDGGIFFLLVLRCDQPPPLLPSPASPSSPKSRHLCLQQSSLLPSNASPSQSTKFSLSLSLLLPLQSCSRVRSAIGASIVANLGTNQSIHLVEVCLSFSPSCRWCLVRRIEEIPFLN